MDGFPSARLWFPGLVLLLLAVTMVPAQEKTAPSTDQPSKTKEPPPKAKLPMPRLEEGGQNVAPLPASILTPEVKDVDLPTVLRLAGVANPQILLAQQRVLEAVALRQLAAAQLLPNINVGTNLDAHVGPLQQSNGNILKVNRDALYLGLGANAVAAGTVNIPGIQWVGNPSDTLFGILIARQQVRIVEADSAAVRNDILLRVASDYVDLLRAEGRLAIGLQNRAQAAEVARLTANFARTGQGRQADADRAATELARRDEELLIIQSDVLAASARLAQQLNLDPSLRLHAIDGWVVPAQLVPDPIPLCELIAIAMNQRPELAARRAAIRQALLALRAAKVLPFSPNMILGYSAGTFGGGSNLVAQPGGFAGFQESRFDSFAGRQDVDAVLYWTAQNLGLGNVALIRAARSRLGQSNFRELIVLDRVRTEVAVAYARTHARFAQIYTDEQAVQSGERAFTEDLTRIRAGAGLPIEVLDSLRLLSDARFDYLDAILNYNRAQFELYVALGQPPADTLARPIPAKLVPPPVVHPPAEGTPEACPPALPAGVRR